MRHKTSFKLGRRSVPQLRARRRRLARTPGTSKPRSGARWCAKAGAVARRGADAEQGELHGPYVYLSVGRVGGASRLLYVPTALVAVVRRRVEQTGRIDGALAEISAINLELLARQELD